MRRTVTLLHQRTGQPLLRGVCWGSSFASRLGGFMFRRRLAPGEALLLVEPRESRLGVSIHMLFVGFPLGVVWVNASGCVVDKVLARPWHPFYAPRAPARFTLETHPDFLAQVTLGDHWVFEDEPLPSLDA